MVNRIQEPELMEHLENAYDNGWSFIRWSRLYRWYDRDRIGKTTWRDIRTRWQEVCDVDGTHQYPLVMKEAKEGLLLICGDLPTGDKKTMQTIDEKLGDVGDE